MHCLSLLAQMRCLNTCPQVALDRETVITMTVRVTVKGSGEWCGGGDTIEKENNAVYNDIKWTKGKQYIHG